MLKLIVALFFAASMLTAQVGTAISCKPAVSYHGFLIYAVEISASTEVEFSGSREGLLTHCSGVVALPNSLAMDVLTAAYKKQNFFGRLWRVVSPAIATSMITFGVGKNEKSATIAGGVIFFVNAVVNLVSETQVDPSRYYTELLPPTVKIPAGEGRTYYFLSGGRVGP